MQRQILKINGLFAFSFCAAQAPHTGEDEEDLSYYTKFLHNVKVFYKKFMDGNPFCPIKKERLAAHFHMSEKPVGLFRQFPCSPLRA